MERLTRKTIHLYWSHAWRYKFFVVLIFASVALANILDLVSPIVLKRFFDILTGDYPVDGDIKAALVRLIAVMLSVQLGSWLMYRVSILATTYFQPCVMADLSRTAFSYLIRHSHRFFANNFSGSLVRKVNRLSRAFERIADEIQWHFLQITISTSGILIVLWTRSSAIALILLIWIIFYIMASILFASWKQKYELAKASKDSEATGVLADAITNADNVAYFTGHEHEESRLDKVLREWRRVSTFTWNLSEISDSVQALFMIAINVILLYVAVGLWQQGVFTIGDFMLIQSYLMVLFSKLWMLGRVMRHLYEAFAEAEEMVEILETPHEISDSLTAKQLKVKKGLIEYDRVSFSFQKIRPVLRNFTLTIRPGEKVAFVGPSGAGKTTAVKLLFRLYDIDGGKIRIDGRNIARVTQDSLRKQISFVPQEPILFHRTLMENIKYGKRNASNKDATEAAKKARCHDFIESLPKKYDTFVGERGVKLSGGERQRVAIARAILKNAPILVLDEATSSLDSESELLIQDALSELMKGKTTIVIAHRLSTIMKMDRIIVVDNGRVVDSGTHKELLKKKGIYKKLWDIQAGGFIQ